MHMGWKNSQVQSSEVLNNSAGVSKRINFVQLRESCDSMEERAENNLFGVL